jgi:hypothetical protein
MNETFNEPAESNEIIMPAPQEAVGASSEPEVAKHEDASSEPEGAISPQEAHRIHEDDEARQVAATLALHLNETAGTNYTAEDLINDPDSETWVSQLIEKHPRARKILNVFMLSTALAGVAGAPKEAEAADPFTYAIVNTVAQGYIRQGNIAAQQHVYQEQAAGRSAIQRQQIQMRAEQAHRDLLVRQQMQQEDLDHRHAMKAIKDPYERERAELDYRQQKERRMEVMNRVRQEENLNIQAQTQQAQMIEQQRYQQEQAARNVQNQVIQRGANHFLQEILMPRPHNTHRR